MRLRYLPAALALAATPAAAHVSADPSQATAGSYAAVRFRVGHGCEDVHATTALRIEIPPGVVSARPQPKPGWGLAIERDGDKVVAIRWTGELPADEFDEFAVFMKLPAAPGVLYFPTVQTCGADEAQWTQVPDTDAERLDHPAPSLHLTSPLTPAAAAGDMHHH